ncbi:MAG: hypothetical protein AB4426_03040 [Xenococcaceae cyanobacterium]
MVTRKKNILLEGGSENNPLSNPNPSAFRSILEKTATIISASPRKENNRVQVPGLLSVPMDSSLPMLI